MYNSGVSHFQSSLAFWLILPLVVVAAYAWIFRNARTPTVQFSSVQFFKNSAKNARLLVVHLPFVLKIFAIVFMIVALARPQKANTKIRNNVQGIDIVLLVDLSLTMLIEDMAPYNRLEAAKVAQIEFVKNRPNDRIGVVAFSGEAFTVVPPTLDHDIVVQRLNELKYTTRIKQGTAQGVAIATGISRLRDSEAKSRVMVFITDGENNTGLISPEVALQMAQGYDIKIYMVGVGSDGTKQLPVPEDDGVGKKITRYQTMSSTFHEEDMIKIANSTGGKYWRSRNLKELNDVYEEIDRLEKTKIDSNTYTKYSELFASYVQAALALLFLSWFLSQTWLRRVPT